MNKNLFRLTVSSALVLSGMTLSPSTAQSAIVTKNIMVDIDSGPLVGNNYTGFVSYDDTLVNPSFSGTLPVTSLSFDFLGTTYTELSDPGATVSFNSGDFLGLDFAVTMPPQPTFISGSITLSEAFFAYSLNPNVPGQAGTGVTTYTNANATTSVPEPGMVYSLLLFGCLGLRSKLRNC